MSMKTKENGFAELKPNRLYKTDLGYVMATMDEPEYLNRERVIAIADRKLNPKWIKEREGGGGITLSYIEGHKVIRLLREATNDRYSVIIHDRFLQESVPRQLYEYNQESRRRDPVFRKHCVNCGKPFHYMKAFRMNATTCPYCQWSNPITMGQHGEAVLEPQPPVAHVLLELVIPGLGTRSAWGSKTVLGGASEQESIYKAAATDALKKAASLFGFALELYDDEEEKAMRTYEINIDNGPPDTSFDLSDPVPNMIPQNGAPQQQVMQPQMQQPQQYPMPQQQPQQMPQQQMQQPVYQQEHMMPPQQQMAQPQMQQPPQQQTQQAQQPVQQPAQQAPEQPRILGYNPKDTEKLGDIKRALGIDAGPEGNPKLNPYVLEFSSKNNQFGNLTSFTDLSPEILPHFNSFMEATYLNGNAS